MATDQIVKITYSLILLVRSTAPLVLHSNWSDSQNCIFFDLVDPLHWTPNWFPRATDQVFKTAYSLIWLVHSTGPLVFHSNWSENQTESKSESRSFHYCSMERGAKRGHAGTLACKDEKGSWSVRQTLKQSKRQCWENFWEMGWSTYGFSWACRYHLVVNYHNLLSLQCWMTVNMQIPPFLPHYFIRVSRDLNSDHLATFIGCYCCVLGLLLSKDEHVIFHMHSDLGACVHTKVRLYCSVCISIDLCMCVWYMKPNTMENYINNKKNDVNTSI